MTKEFKRGYMHPTRRKLVDMVMTGGEYESPVTIGWTGKTGEEQRKVGEIWTDSDGKQWKQTEGGKITHSAYGDVMADARAFLSKMNTCAAPDCKTKKYGRVDKKLISKTGFCLHCLTKKEAQIKYDGLWDVYEGYKVYSNMIGYGKDVLAKLNQALADVKQEYDFIHEDGRTEKWVLEKDADEMRAEILIDITNIERELSEVIALRDAAWEKLKDKGYDLIKAPTE